MAAGSRSTPHNTPDLPLAVPTIIRHVHPVLLLALLQFSFQKMVANPESTLSRMLVPLIGLQTVYLFFNQVKSVNNGVSGAGKKKIGGNIGAIPGSGAVKRSSGEVEPSIVGTKILPAVLSLTLSTTFGTFFIFATLILFGAPLTTHLLPTFLCASHIAILAGYPLIYTHHMDENKWRDMISLQLPLDEVYGASLGTFLGAWIGAVPIPLDWDREWQKWPITIVVGAYMGYSIGRYVGLALEGKKIPF